MKKNRSSHCNVIMTYTKKRIDSQDVTTKAKDGESCPTLKNNDLVDGHKHIEVNHNGPCNGKPHKPMIVDKSYLWEKCKAY